jgi:hypothetical protein
VTGPQLALDLWHPTANPQSRLCLGEDAATRGDTDNGSPVGLAVIAPGATQSTREWFQSVFGVVRRRLTDDGIVWVFVRRGRRRAARRAIRNAGLVLADAVVMVPPAVGASHLVPLRPGPLVHGAARHLRIGQRLARLAAPGPVASLTRVVGSRILRGYAFVAVRRDAPQLFAWLDGVIPKGGVTAFVSLSSRVDARTATVFRYPNRGSQLDLVVKVGLDEEGRSRIERERTALTQLRPHVVSAGASMPRVREMTLSWALATDPLPGESIASVLARRSRALDETFEHVATWLAKWNLLTATRVDAPIALLERLVRAPAALVANAAPDLVDYADDILALARRVERRPLVVVATHNDLTMANVLLDGRRLSILDWEEAQPTGLPLTDLWYALVDALARAQRVTHAEAMLAYNRRAPCRVLDAAEKHAAALGVNDDQTKLAFHATWLHHAANEVRRGSVGGPFLGALRAVAADPTSWPSARDHGGR